MTCHNITIHKPMYTPLVYILPHTSSPTSHHHTASCSFSPLLSPSFSPLLSPSFSPLLPPSSTFSVVLDACVNGSFVSIAKQVESHTKSSQSSKSVTTAKDTNTRSSNCVVLTWSIPHIEGSFSSHLLSTLHPYHAHPL